MNSAFRTALAHIVLLTTFLGACGLTGGVSAQPSDVGAASSAIDGNLCAPLTISLERNNDMSIVAKVHAQEYMQNQCVRATNKRITLSTDRGTISRVEQLPNGVFKAVITPEKQKTGEYRITASMKPNLKTSVTAVVLEKVNSRWGQPMAVPGLVNTPGWEDSPFISPDGQYLFIMYMPVSGSCVLEQKQHRASCFKNSGPIDETSRPGLASRFGKKRFAADNRIIHRCPGVGDIYSEAFLKKYSVIIPPMISYGFKRRPDGSFGAPFPITVEGVSACVSPSGLDVHIDRQGRATAVMGLVDPASWNTDVKDDYPSLYTAQIELNKPNAMAIWDKHSKKLKPTTKGLKLLFGTAMKERQDNPHTVVNPKTGKIEAVFWDSEHDEPDIFYRLLEPNGIFPDGPWGPVMKTPVFSSFFRREFQPFFDGSVLTITTGRQIASRDFYGTNFRELAKSRKWGKERIELALSENLKGNENNLLHGIGEPTYATIGGKKHLYFAYLKRNNNGLLDFNIGFVREK